LREQRLFSTFLLCILCCSGTSERGLVHRASRCDSETCLYDQGAIIRGPTSQKEIALIFTGGDFSDGGDLIQRVLKYKNVKANFFFTGDFYRNPSHSRLISQMVGSGHYLGPHSDKHLLYCSWENRDTFLVTEQQFVSDLLDNYKSMKSFGIEKERAAYFIPPYEWYNRQIAAWAKELGVTLINFTPGTDSNADYTTPSMSNFKSSDSIFKSIMNYEISDPEGLKGFLLLQHIGTHPDRKDKFYHRLEELIDTLQRRGYVFVRVDRLLMKCQDE
jgi:endoglucanase